MRTRIALLGIGIMSSFAPAEQTFDTLFDQNLAIDGQHLTSVSQVVLGNGGRVALIGGMDSDAGNGALLLRDGSAAASMVAHVGDTAWGAAAGGTPGFQGFWNLSLADGSAGEASLTFVGGADSLLGGYNFGIFQYIAGTTPQKNRVLFEGDVHDSQTFSFNTTGPLPFIRQQTNATGQALFSGKLASGEQILVRGGSGTAQTVFTDAGGTLTNFNNDPNVLNAITPGGAAVFIATRQLSPSSRIDLVDSTGATRFAGGTTIDSEAYTPELLLGSTNTNSLLLAKRASDNAMAFILHHQDSNSSEDYMLAAYNPLTDYSSFSPTGEISANGNAAFYVPGSSGGSVGYFDAATAGGRQVAFVGQALVNGLSIRDISIASNGSGPMVNDDGTVVFDAVLSDGTDALLAWREGWTEPSVLVKVGDTVPIGGSDHQILALVPNTLSIDGSVYKDGLSEDSHVAFGLYYLDGDEPKTAVLMTAIPLPEPAAGSASLFLLAGSFYAGGGVSAKKQRPGGGHPRPLSEGRENRSI